MRSLLRGRLPLPLATMAATLLAIEFLDELVFGAREAAWPAIRTDLSLSYLEIGLLLAIPEIFSALVEPVFGVLGDSKWRARLIAAGGAMFGGALLIAAFSPGFVLLLVAFLLLYPASGAFVSLSQATLIDQSGDRHDEAMARWTLAGSVGVVAGPIALWIALAAGIDWRGLFVIFAGVTFALAARSVVARRTANGGGGSADDEEEEEPGIREAARLALRAARKPVVWRWLILLAFADLMLDTFLAFLALYLVDSAGYSLERATVALAVWAGFGLAGDALLVVLLKRFDGLRYLRVSAAVVLGLATAFLLVPSFEARLAILAVLGLFNAGWYAIPQARLYASLPGQSGAVVALSSAFGLVDSLIPIAIGAIAAGAGIGVAMWFLLLGPVALLIGLPRSSGPAPVTRSEAP
jgi:FSR family fosmidomycin resistance protein-like MFS transporter